MQVLAQPGPGPLPKAAPDGAIRTAGAGDALVAGAVYQCRNDVLEDHSIGHAPTVAAQGMGRSHEGALRQQAGELFPARLQQARWQDRHGFLQDGMAKTSTVAGGLPNCYYPALSAY